MSSQRLGLRTARPFFVLTLANSAKGVGKSTLATQLAPYFRLLREDLPVLFLELDDEPLADRMFRRDGSSRGQDIRRALRAGNLESAIRLGQYGVHYVPSSRGIGELEAEIQQPFRLRSVLERSGWRGLVIIDTPSDFGMLTRSALAAADLTLVVVDDSASLVQAQRCSSCCRPGSGLPSRRGSASRGWICGSATAPGSRRTFSASWSPRFGARAIPCSSRSSRAAPSWRRSRRARRQLRPPSSTPRRAS